MMMCTTTPTKNDHWALSCCPLSTSSCSKNTYRVHHVFGPTYFLVCISFMCQFHSIMNQTSPSMCSASSNEVTTGATTTITSTATTIMTTVLNDQNKDWLFRASIPRQENQKCSVCLRDHIMSCDVESNPPVKTRYFQLKLRGEASVTSPSITTVHRNWSTTGRSMSGRVSSSKQPTNANNKRSIFLLSDDPWDCPFSDSY